MAHVRKSSPDAGIGFQVEYVEPFQLFPFRSEAIHDLGVASGPVREGVIWRRRRPLPHRLTNLIAASIQFQYDPDELATNITTQLVHKSNSETYV